jgi:hypothetical protein
VRPIHAVLVLTGALLTACQNDSAPSGRAGGMTVALASPIGFVQPGDKRIVWNRSEGAARYEVVINDSTERPIFSAITRDTQVVVPDAVPYLLTQNYRWYVTAYRDTDSTAWRSPVAVFRLDGPGRRMPPRPN